MVSWNGYREVFHSLQFFCHITCSSLSHLFGFERTMENRGNIEFMVLVKNFEYSHIGSCFCSIWLYITMYLFYFCLIYLYIFTISTRGRGVKCVNCCCVFNCCVFCCLLGQVMLGFISMRFFFYPVIIKVFV